MIALRQPQTCSHLFYAQTLTGGCFLPANFMYLYPQEPWRVTYYLLTTTMESNAWIMFYLLKLYSSRLKACRTLGPTACL